ncbi:MAG: FadR/GntR family transcriptional regulator [Betaproteobacteria bacterium]
MSSAALSSSRLRTPRALVADRSRRQVAGTAKRTLKSTKVVDMLGFRIVSGELPAGALLPTEAELSTQLGISRPSLREGLRALAGKGLVEGRTRRGTTVNARREWNVLDEDVLRWLSMAPPDPAFFIDLLDVRMIVEPAAARIAASRASSEQILAMESACRGMVAATPHDMETCCTHDLALHELIITSTGNPMLIRFAAAIRTALLACVRIASIARETSAEHSLSEHQAVVAAIRRRDPDGAELAMKNLLAGTIRDLAPAYDKYPRGIPPPPPSRATAKTPRRA